MLAALMLCVMTVLAPAGAMAAAKQTTLVGEVATVAADSFELKTATSTVTVKLTGDTKFVLDQKPSDKTQLRAGERVVATISKAKTGDMTASRVIVGLGTATAKATPTQ
jgi:hypothetical protein